MLSRQGPVLELRPLASLQNIPSPIIFLAGSIEMGKASNWQQDMVTQLSDMTGSVLNPRREAWESTWPQDASFPPFRAQVEWELAGLAQADIVIFYFEPTTKSPVTLLELGLTARATCAGQQTLVCCPSGFWRKGNVDIVCEWWGMPQFETLDNLVVELRHRLAKKI
ncbi:MAG: nucleoside 2-deoxyribosyltransferase domain-containing protein [Cyanobacteria bacterium P01_D01_bin.44]